MLVESGSTTILNTPQNIYQTSPRVCSTYSSQQDTVHLIHQWLQTNRIKSCWWMFFPAQHLLNSLLEDLGLLFPFCKYWANIHFPLHSIYYCSLWAPLAGPREVLLSPRCHFHVSFGVIGGGSVLQKVWGHPAQLYSLLADSSVFCLLLSDYKAVVLVLDSFLSWKIPFVCSGETPTGLLWLTQHMNDMDLFEQVQSRAVLVIRRTEPLSCEHRLRELGLLSLGKRRFRNTL